MNILGNITNVFVVDGTERQATAVRNAVPNCRVIVSLPGWTMRKLCLASGESVTAILMFAQGRETHCISMCGILRRNPATSETPIVMACESTPRAFLPTTRKLMDVSMVSGVVDGHEELLQTHLQSIVRRHNS